MVSGPPGHRPVGVDYIAHKTGYSESTIHNWRRTGHLPTPNPPHHRARGGGYLWPKHVIDTWLADNFDL